MTGRRATPPIEWNCDGQEDLLDHVDTEHLSGSMPADEDEREKARRKYYDTLPKLKEDASG